MADAVCRSPDGVSAVVFDVDGTLYPQSALASIDSGYPTAAVAEIVELWTERAPLDVIDAARWQGVSECLQMLRRRGVRLGALSGYPAHEKLRAMGLDSLFDAVVCAQDGGVGRFKPDSAGLRMVLERLGVPPDRAVYIGDRPDVDAPAARGAGARCYIIGRPGAHGAGWTGVQDYAELGILFESVMQPERGERCRTR